MLKQGGDPMSNAATMQANQNALASHTSNLTSKANSMSYVGAQGSYVKYTPPKTETVAQQQPFFSTNQCGGASSDWRGSNYSRGPVNYPVNGWNNGEKMFRQFSKNAEYIPNNKLAHSIAPISTGVVKEKSPVGLSTSGWGHSFSKF